MVQNIVTNGDSGGGQPLPNAVDAVDLLDASFNNISLSGEANEAEEKPEVVKPKKKHDDDFSAFKHCSSRLQETAAEPTAAAPDVANILMEKDVSQKSVTANNNDGDEDDLVEPELVVRDSIQETTTPDPKQRFVSPKDFELLKVIGMGAFGKVLQVRNKASNQILAMKVISKRLLRRKSGYVENIHAERNILTRVRHPFVVMMHCSFQTSEKLFIIMDFLAGGELFLRLGREGIFLEREAAFYLAEIILALDHLHNLGILHRDLKPENVLLGSDGHVCLTDFGLAKDFGAGGFQSEEDESRASTICGTQEYMAPEMVASKGYGRAADFWSLGCIAYEMLNGLPPFQSKMGAKDLFRKIMSEKVKMPVGSTAAACKLLKGLLNRNPRARLGAARSTMFEVGGTASLKGADFFKHVDWEKLERKEVEPPKRLDVENYEDLKHFHDEFVSMPLPRSVVQYSKGSKKARHVESENFRGFSFIQEDFLLPEREQKEIEEYYNSADEDAESVSECASSKNDLDLGEQRTEPEKKKRPPRKRKKKKAAADAASVASSDGGIKTPPIQNGEKAEPATKEYTIKALEPSNVKALETANAARQKLEVPPVAPQPAQSNTPAKSATVVPPRNAPAAKSPPKQDAWQPVGSADKEGQQQLRASAPKYIPPQQMGGATEPSGGWGAPRYPQQGGLQPVGMQRPQQQKNRTQQPQTALRSQGWGQQQQQHHQPQPSQAGARGWATAGPTGQQYPAAPAATFASKSPAPGSWAAKTSIQSAPTAPAHHRQMSPHDVQSATTIPPSPSSDWRNHPMSASPRKVVKTVENWPGLGDSPALPTLNQAKNNPVKKAPPPAGAWVARKR